MGIYESVNPIKISDLTKEIHDGVSVLPEFQRDFVWDPGATAGLISSVVNDFPAGSILRVKTKDDFFATRFFDGAPTTNDTHTYLVLDGQQRLTSLYQALYGVGKYRYFLDLNRALSSENWSEDEVLSFVKVKKNSKALNTRVLDVSLHAEKKEMPLQVIFGREGGYWKWVMDVLAIIPEDERPAFQSLCQKLHEVKLKALEQYVFPVVTLNPDTSPAALCTIFETLNSTGTRLSVFELLTARFAIYRINLKEMWDSARDLNPDLDLYGVDAYSVLQAISLLKGISESKVPRCQKKDILKLEKKDIDDYWEKILTSLAYGIEIVRDDCHIPNAKWMPTPSMFAPLATIVALSDRKGLAAGRHRSMIRCWLWCAIFGKRYEAAANTRAERDVADFRRWIANGEVPELLAQFRFDEFELQETNVRSAPIYKGVIALVLGRESRDFYKNNVISSEMLKTGEVDDHHVFPDSYLDKKMGVEKSKRDCVLNRTLISRDTNIKISDKAPSEYLAEMDQHGHGVPGILQAHFISGPVADAMREDDFERFLKERSTLLRGEIERVTAVPEFE
jgi:hypothetical protein